MQAEIEPMVIWSVHSTCDDRGSIGGTVGYFSSQYTANEKAEGQGWYGGRGVVKQQDAVRINNAVYVLLSKNPIDLDGVQKTSDEKLKAETLASLSAEQKRVLGLS